MNKIVLNLVILIVSFVSLGMLLSLSINTIGGIDTTTDTTNAVIVFNDVVSLMPTMGVIIGAVFFMVILFMVAKRWSV